MRLRQLGILLSVVLCSFLASHVEAGPATYLAGTMSFSVINNPSTSKQEAQMDFLIGYLLNTGPCGSPCTAHEIGKNTSGGNYEVTWQLGSQDVGNVVKASSLSQVFAVDTVSMNKWELEWWRSKIPLDSGSQIEKINVGGLSFPSALVTQTWKMKVEIDLSLRNDTNMINKSPIVFVKPVYRVANGKSQIYIAAIDPDGDFVKCEDGVSTEHGHLATDGVTGITVNADCMIDLDSSQISGGPLIGLGINVRDYAKETIKLGSNDFGAYELSLSKTPVQFLVDFSASILGPIFVEPTMADNQKFIVYIGASLATPLCVQTANNIKVKEFRVLEREGMSFQQNTMSIHNDESRTNIQCTTFSWKPTPSDVGNHIVCITAIDDQGNDTPQDKCFLIEIKEVDYEKFPSSYSTLQFSDFPKFLQTDSKTAMVLPISVFSKSGQPNIDVVTTDLTYKASSIEPYQPNIYTKSYTLHESDFGSKTICFTAAIGQEKAEACLEVKYLPPNPCISNPCKNGGKCQRKPGQDVDFVCSCPSRFTGKDCSANANDICDPNPCIHGEKCLSHTPPVVCLCQRRYFSGSTCEVDLDSCKNVNCGHGVCIDKENGSSCICYPGYTGQHCETDICRNNPNDPRCTQTCSHCINGGVCFYGHCACPTGYTGASCDTLMPEPSTGIAFIPPTLGEGTTLVCYFQGDTLQPFHMVIAVASPNDPIPKLVISQATGTFKTDSSIDSFSCSQHVCKAIISIKGSKDDGMNFICVNVSDSKSTAERCFVLQYKVDPVGLTGTFENAQKDKAIKFELPTPYAGSQFSCYVNDQCRLVLYTSKDGSTCQTIRTTSIDVSIFPTNDADGTCQTEVMFTSSTASSTPKEICFLSGTLDSSSQTRCYFMNVQPRGSDPCDAKPCQNGGMCIKNGTGYYCTCDKGFSGSKCEKGMCVDDTDCVHGQCAIYDLVKSCLCDIGYTGDKCQIEIQSKVGNADTNGVLFTDMVMPKMLPCVIGLPCSINLIMSGYLPSGRPILQMGYVDPAVAVDQISIKPNNTIGSFRAEIVVSSKKTGLHIVCVQTFNTHKVNKDELCITLSMSADAMTIFSDETVPHFLEPSLQPDAVTRCAVDETCHVWYTYTSGTHNKADIELSTDTLKTDLYRTECKTISSAEKNCSLDIFLRPKTDEVGKSFKICVSLSVKSNPTVKGENRCFTVDVVQESALDDQRKCRQHQCEHNGFCDGHGSSAKCYCPQGFEGSNCEQVYTPNFAGKSSSIAGDKAVPKAIGCKLNIVCHVPLQLFLNQGRCTAPQIRAGYRSSGINFVKATMTSVQEGNRARNFSGSAELMPTQTGIQHICLQAVDNGTTLSEFCFELTVNGPTDENLKRPYFIEPTYLNGATLYCEKSKECHFTLHYARGEKFDSEQECPGVKDTYPVAHNAGQLLRTFTTEAECYNDVLLTATVVEIIKLCYQLELPRNIGEERCFYIEVVDDLSTKVKTPCDGITCSPWQVCISNLTASVSPPYTCVNETGYVAKTIQDVAIFVDLPPYTESLGCASDTCTVPLYVLSPINEITSVGVSRGQNKSVFNVNPPQTACHNYVDVYRADLQVTASKLDPAQTLCLMANDSNGLASDVTCILPKPPAEEGMNVGVIVGGAVGGVAAIGGGVAAAVFLRKKQCVKKIMSRRQSKVDTPESKKTSKNGSKNGVSVIEMDTTTDTEQITEIILSMKVKKSKV